MKDRVCRCIALTILAFAVLLAMGSPIAAQESPRAQPGAAFARIAPPQAKQCVACAAAYEKCSVTCFGGDKASMGACLTSCDNEAAGCTCDPVVNLRSEDLVDWDPSSLDKAACHGNVSCQPNYPSCASWSGYSDCGTPFCGTGIHCGECTCDEIRCFCGPGPAWKQQRERFRVCFNAAQQSCTEWQTTTIISCGC